MSEINHIVIIIWILVIMHMKTFVKGELRLEGEENFYSFKSHFIVNFHYEYNLIAEGCSSVKLVWNNSDDMGTTFTLFQYKQDPPPIDVRPRGNFSYSAMIVPGMTAVNSTMSGYVVGTHTAERKYQISTEFFCRQTSVANHSITVTLSYCPRSPQPMLKYEANKSYNDSSEVYCANEATLYSNMTKFHSNKSSSVCGRYGKWVDNFSCWFGPKVMLVGMNTTYRQNDNATVTCSVIPGFPAEVKLSLLMGNVSFIMTANKSVEVRMIPDYNGAAVYCNVSNQYLKDQELAAVTSDKKDVSVEFHPIWDNVPCINSTKNESYSILFYSHPQLNETSAVIKINESTMGNYSVNGTLERSGPKKYGTPRQKFTAFFKALPGSNVYIEANYFGIRYIKDILRCDEVTTSAVLSATTWTTTTLTTVSKTSIGDDDGNGLAALIGGIGGGTATVLLVALLVICIKRRRQGNHFREEPNVLYGQAEDFVEVGERQVVANELYQSPEELQVTNGQVDENTARRGNNVEGDPSELYAVVRKDRNRNGGVSKEVALPGTSVE